MGAILVEQNERALQGRGNHIGKKKTAQRRPRTEHDARRRAAAQHHEARVADAQRRSAAAVGRERDEARGRRAGAVGRGGAGRERGLFCREGGVCVG